MSRPSIALLAPQGWSVKNWVVSRFADALTERADLIVYSPQAEELSRSLAREHLSFAYMAAPELTRSGQLILRTIHNAHFYRRSSFTHRYMLSLDRSHWGWKSRALDVGRKVGGRALQYAPPVVFESIERASLGMRDEMERLEKDFRTRGVDLVFSTVPLSVHYERPALWAARRLGIRTACMIASWDNLYSKGRLPIRFDHYLAWSEVMRDELLRQYPRVGADDITVTGPPQFDSYRDPSLLESRESFLRRIGGDPARKLILWAGASLNQMPNEPLVLEQLCEAARAVRLNGNPQILVRPHPIGGGERFARVRERFPELLFTETNAADPSSLIGWTPLKSDIALLANSIAHADVTINHCSTMTLDCCALDRPVVNLAFDIEPGSKMEAYVRDVYKFEHYETVLDAGAVRMAYSLDDLVKHLNAYLADPASERAQRAALLRLQAFQVDGHAGERAASTLLRIAA